MSVHLSRGRMWLRYATAAMHAGSMEGRPNAGPHTWSSRIILDVSKCVCRPSMSAETLKMMRLRANRSSRGHCLAVASTRPCDTVLPQIVSRVIHPTLQVQVSDVHRENIAKHGSHQEVPQNHKAFCLGSPHISGNILLHDRKLSLLIAGQ